MSIIRRLRFGWYAILPRQEEGGIAARFKPRFLRLLLATAQETRADGLHAFILDEDRIARRAGRIAVEQRGLTDGRHEQGLGNGRTKLGRG